MTARRAARAPKGIEPTIATTGMPASIEIGPCVEVWGTSTKIPSGLNRKVDQFFAAAMARFQRVRTAVDPQAEYRSPPAAWSTDQRTLSPRRLRAVVVDDSIDAAVRLAAHGCGRRDLRRLRSEAVQLLEQVPPTVEERARQIQEVADALADQ